jgi:hypothetical protein
MKTILASTLALTTLIASATLAVSAPRRHLAPADPGYAMQSPNKVYFGNRVIGQDPDANIRGQMEHDPLPNEY